MGAHGVETPTRSAGVMPRPRRNPKRRVIDLLSRWLGYWRGNSADLIAQCGLARAMELAQVYSKQVSANFSFKPPRWGSRWRGGSAVWPPVCAGALRIPTATTLQRPLLCVLASAMEYPLARWFGCWPLAHVLKNVHCKRICIRARGFANTCIFACEIY